MPSAVPHGWRELAGFSPCCFSLCEIGEAIGKRSKLTFVVTKNGRRSVRRCEKIEIPIYSRRPAGRSGSGTAIGRDR